MHLHLILFFHTVVRKLVLLYTKSETIINRYLSLNFQKQTPYKANENSYKLHSCLGILHSLKWQCHNEIREDKQQRAAEAEIWDLSHHVLSPVSQQHSYDQKCLLLYEPLKKWKRTEKSTCIITQSRNHLVEWTGDEIISVKITIYANGFLQTRYWFISGTYIMHEEWEKQGVNRASSGPAH